jgi:uncharacterized membrane protein
VATGFPFGSYAYSSALGPRLLGVPAVIPLAWTWMAWPAWLVAGRLVTGVFRAPLAGVALAAWDLFLDPQMVAEGYWTWHDRRPALPGVPDIPVSNYLGWLLVAVVLMALLSTVPDTRLPDTRVPDTRRPGPDAPMHALYLWTYASGVLAPHAVAAAGGQFFAVRATTYARASGHEAVRDRVLEDIELARAVKRAGGRIALADGSTLATCRMYTSWPDLGDGYGKSLWASFSSRPPGRWAPWRCCSRCTCCRSRSC